MNPRLSTKQRALVQELAEISDLLSLDFYNIAHYPKGQRTARLEVMRRAFVRAHVITEYVRMDEYLNCVLCDYFFKTRDYIRLWKTKRFKYFNYHILEERKRPT